MNPTTMLITGRAIADGAGFAAAPGAVLLALGRPDHAVPAGSVLAVGTGAEVARHPAAATAVRVDRPRSVLLPGLVNAHTHLDLTHIGPRPHDRAGGFTPWVDMVRSERAVEAADIERSVRRGVRLSFAGGTVAVGDIAGAPRGRPSLTPWRALRDSGLAGVSYLEFFAIGTGEERGLAAGAAALAEARGEEEEGHERWPVRVGLQPHAPNTVSLKGYRWAIGERGRRGGLPLTTHLAETPEERRFIADAEGPQRDLLGRFGLWDDAILEDIGRGLHPVAHLAGVLDAPPATPPFAVVHLNDADDAALVTLARAGVSVVYCPRASAYFGAERHFGPHRYREMLAAGVNVALGTDSLVNLPPDAATVERGGIGVLEEMRLLARRDGLDPRTALNMGTRNGAVAIGMDPAAFKFGDTGMGPGVPLAGLIAVEVPGVRANRPADPLEMVMRCEGPPELLLNWNGSCVTGL